MSDNPFALPHVDRVFRLLARGRHLCIDDGELYWALRENAERFTALFDAIGFRLERHTRDFYYFVGDDLSDAGEKMAVFMLVLIEHLGDSGIAVEEGLMQREWRYAELPHLATERYRELAAAVDIKDEKALRGIVQSLDRFGFAETLGEAAFRFRRPAYRFLDLCIAIATDDGKESA